LKDSKNEIQNQVNSIKAKMEEMTKEFYQKKKWNYDQLERVLEQKQSKL